MIAFILENENPFASKLTHSGLQAIYPELQIIRIKENQICTIYNYLSEYSKPFFLVFQSGQAILHSYCKDIMLLLSQIEEGEAGVADIDEKRGVLPIIWRTNAVLSVPKMVWNRFPFAHYSLNHLYFYLSKKWRWNRVELSRYVITRLQEPQWKRQDEAWKLLLPIISAESPKVTERKRLVSVVICTHNDGVYLSTAIQSVLIQSNPNWELIIVNDGSTDDTEERLAIYQGDPRVCVLKNKVNVGKARSLNTALSIAKGEWLLELDADDWLTAECIEQMLLEAKGKQAVLLYANHYEWLERKNKKMIYNQVQKAPNILDKITLLDHPLPIAPRMLHIPFLKEIGGWCVNDPYGGRLYEDLFLLSQCTSHHYLHLSRPLYHRRLRHDSITQREMNKFSTWKQWFTEIYEW